MRKNQLLSWLEEKIDFAKFALTFTKSKKAKSNFRVELKTLVQVWEKVSGQKWPK